MPTGHGKAFRKNGKDGSETGLAKGPKMAPSQTAKNPIMLLNELRQGVEYKMVRESGDPHAKTFKFVVTVEGQSFEGTGKQAFDLFKICAVPPMPSVCVLVV